jgi:hypothetical protein
MRFMSTRIGMAVALLLAVASTSLAATQPLAVDFTVAGPASMTVMPGSSSSASYRVVAINGFSEIANVAVLPPAGFNGSVVVETSSVAAGEEVTIRVTATIATRPGPYSFVVIFTSGALAHEQTVTLIVTQQPRHRVVSR